ncbi:MAG: hypothetical protein AB7V15_10845, partial [Acidimicrobiia bacterium]
MSAPAQDLSPQDVPVEREIAFDIVRRGALAAPVLVLVGAAIWGADGAASVGYGIGIVLVNLVLSALMLAWAARRSPAWLMGT